MRPTRVVLPQRPQRLNQRGFVLLFSWMVPFALILLTQVGLARAVTEGVAANRFVAKQQAFQVADGQLDNVLAALAKDPSSLLTGTCPPSVDPTRTSCTLQDVTQQLDPTATALQGTRQARIVVTGFMPNRTTPQAQATIEAIVEVDGASIFQWPMFADQVIFQWQSNLVDGYDSTGGTPYPYGGLGPGASRPIRAQIRSNGSMLFQNFPMKPASYFWTDLMVGPAYNPASTGITTTGPVYLKGAQATAPAAIILPPVAAASGTPLGSPYLHGDCGIADAPLLISINANPYSMISVGADCKVMLQGDGSVSFDEITMGTRGTLQLEGNMVLTAGKLDSQSATLRLATGSATIHVTGNDMFAMVGNIDNVTHVPSNLLFVLDTTSSIDFMTAYKSTIYAAFYAPNAVYVFFHYTGGELFGSVVTKNQVFVNGNWKFHYDQALRNLQQSGVSASPVRIRLWRQL